MPASLDAVFPWGRSADEYAAMFDLNGEDLAGRVLDCGGGPSSFTAEMSARGLQAVSCDPLYLFGAAEIARRVEETRGIMRRQNEAHADRFLWDRYGSPRELGRRRIATMRLFLADYSRPAPSGRYVAGELPNLPFKDGCFRLALCSHLLFTYSDTLSQAFHIAAVLELARVAREVRIFPLVTAFVAAPSPHLAAVTAALQQRGRRTNLRRVPYEFQRGADTMMVISPPD